VAEEVELDVRHGSQRWFVALLAVAVPLFLVVPSVAMVAKLFGAPFSHWAEPWSSMMSFGVATACTAPLWAGLAAGLAAYLGRSRRRTVRLDRDALQVGERTIPLADVAAVGGPMAARAARDEVVLLRRDAAQEHLSLRRIHRGTLEAFATRLRERVGLGRVRAALQSGPSRVGRVLGAAVFAAVAGAMVAPQIAPPFDVLTFLAILWGATGLSVFRNRGAEILVGADGVRLPRRRGLPRFVPFRAIRDVAFDGKRLVLRLRNGKGLPLPTERMAPAARDALQRAILDRRRAVSDEPEHLGALGREGEGAAWLENVRALLEGERGFRELALDEHAVLRVLEDDGAEREQRIAAALALLAKDRDATRPRVRVAVEQTADADLEEALEAALEGDDARVLRVLDRS